MSQELTEKNKSLIFWASFLSLTAAGMGFAFRVAHMGSYGAEFELTNQQVGMIFGATLWPIALTMIGFSLFLDKTGFKKPMFVAFALQALASVGTFMAGSYETLLAFALCAGLAHGIVEAVINPVCAAIYPRDKTVRLTVLHAAWPAGLVLGTLPIIGLDAVADVGWRVHALWMFIPALAYAIMYIPCVFPMDERVKAGVPFMEMLREVGFLTSFLAGGLMVFELGNQFSGFSGVGLPDQWFYISMGIGLVIGAAFGAYTKSLGKPLFFFMCLLMIPVATAELGTDGWIKGLMTPVLSDMSINPAFALVFSAAVMLVLRVFAGPILRLASPPTILAISGLGSAVGLLWLSEAAGIAVFIAFLIYAIGQTYYWPCVLGFVSERYPKGGALSLNTVSAIGLLSVGIIGGPMLGVAFDRSIHGQTTEQLPKVAEAAETQGGFLFTSHMVIDPGKKNEYVTTLEAEEAAQVEETYGAIGVEAGRDVLKFASIFPIILIVSFGAIALYFKSRGGYKPIVLEDAVADGEASSTAEAQRKAHDAAEEAAEM